MSDPYLYPGTTTLINNFAIKNSQNLQELESAHYHIKLQQDFPLGKFDYVSLKAIHAHLFGDVYPWAGQERTVDIAKGNSYFCHVQFINKELKKIFEKLKNDELLNSLEKPVFCKKLAYYFNEINAVHPFREGNGRTLRLFCQNLAKNAGYDLAWPEADRAEYLQASIAGFQTDDTPMCLLLEKLVSR